MPLEHIDPLFAVTVSLVLTVTILFALTRAFIREYRRAKKETQQ